MLSISIHYRPRSNVMINHLFAYNRLRVERLVCEHISSIRRDTNNIPSTRNASKQCTHIIIMWRTEHVLVCPERCAVSVVLVIVDVHVVNHTLLSFGLYPSNHLITKQSIRRDVYSSAALCVYVCTTTTLCPRRRRRIVVLKRTLPHPHHDGSTCVGNTYTNDIYTDVLCKGSNTQQHTHVSVSTDNLGVMPAYFDAYLWVRC